MIWKFYIDRFGGKGSHSITFSWGGGGGLIGPKKYYVIFAQPLIENFIL